MDLKDDPYVNQLILNRELGKKSEWLYRYNIGKYCDLIGLTPKELIDEAVEEYNLHPSQRKVRKHLLDWKEYLLNSHYAKSTRKRMFDHVRYFYYEFEIELPKKVKMKNEPEEQISIDDLPSIEDLRFTLNNTNLRTQAIILLMCSSGLSKLDIRCISYNDFLKSISDYYKPSKQYLFDMGELIKNLEGKEVVGTWVGKREKPPHIKYITFHTSETSKAILNYLKTDPPKSLDDCLFRYKGRQITEEAFDKYFNLLCKRCGFPKGYIVSHNFRIRFLTLLAENEVDFIRAELMGGHILPETQRSYYKTLTVETMKKTYLMVMPSLCIVDDVETRVLTDDLLRGFEEREQVREREMVEMRRLIDDIRRDRELP